MGELMTLSAYVTQLAALPLYLKAGWLLWMVWALTQIEWRRRARSASAGPSRRALLILDVTPEKPRRSPTLTFDLRGPIEPARSASAGDEPKTAKRRRRTRATRHTKDSIPVRVAVTPQFSVD